MEIISKLNKIFNEQRHEWMIATGNMRENAPYFDIELINAQFVNDDAALEKSIKALFIKESTNGRRTINKKASK